MGWSGANRIFNPVARALIDAGATPEAQQKVLGDLIKGLQDGDWDTADESLEDFLDAPAVIAAFADAGVHLADNRCCRAALANDPAALLLAMRSDDVSEEEMARAIDAYAHVIAERVRADANLRATEGEQSLATYGRSLADWIDPHVNTA